MNIRNKLRTLLEALDAAGEEDGSGLVRAALSGTDSEVADFVRSNQMWGGAGSIADQSFLSGPREIRRRGLAAMVELGDLQVEMGIVNVRTAFWTEAFSNWLRDGIV